MGRCAWGVCEGCGGDWKGLAYAARKAACEWGGAHRHTPAHTSTHKHTQAHTSTHTGTHRLTQLLEEFPVKALLIHRVLINLPVARVHDSSLIAAHRAMGRVEAWGCPACTPPPPPCNETSKRNYRLYAARSYLHPLRNKRPAAVRTYLRITSPQQSGMEWVTLKGSISNGPA